MIAQAASSETASSNTTLLDWGCLPRRRPLSWPDEAIAARRDIKTWVNFSKS